MRTSKRTAPIVLCVALAATGCTKQAKQVNQLTQELTEARRQIVELQETNTRLWQEVETIKTRKPPAPPMDAVEKLVAEQMQGMVSNKIAQMIQTEFQKQVGTQDDIESIFQQTLSDQMAAADAKKEEERQKQREDWREQQAKRREDRERNRMESMAKELSLDDEQKDKVAAIRTETSTEMRETMSKIWNEKGMDINAMREARVEITDKNNSQMRDVMDDDQYSSYTNSQAQRYGWMESLFSGGGGGGRGGRGSSPNPQPPTPPPSNAIQIR